MKDIDRDPHLSAALRHAPDAGLSAPADISAQILAAAHRAAAKRAPVPPRRESGFFGRPWRLGASGAFASVALAGVIGLLWRGESTPGAAPERVAEAAPVAASAVPINASAAVVAAAPPARSEARADVRVAARAAQMATKPGAKPAIIDTPAPAVALAPPPMPTPAPPAAAPAAPAPDNALSDTAEAPAQARAARSGLLRAQAESPSNRQAAAPAAIMAVPRPEGPWMDALAAGKDVSWRIDGQARAPTSSWLYALAEQTQGRWRTASGVPPAQGDNEVQWWRNGVLQGRLWLGAQRVLWCGAQGACEEAPLDGGVTTALRKSLSQGLTR